MAGAARRLSCGSYASLRCAGCPNLGIEVEQDRMIVLQPRLKANMFFVDAAQYKPGK